MNESTVLFAGFATISLLFIVLLYKKVNNFLSSYVSSVEKDINDSEKILNLAKQNLEDARKKFLIIEDSIDDIKNVAHNEIEAVIAREEELTDLAIKNHESILNSKMEVMYNSILNELKGDILSYFKEEVLRMSANDNNAVVAKIDDDLLKIFNKVLQERAKDFKN
jgi:F0F1-type ATP synthase membrane subunit b/b'